MIIVEVELGWHNYISDFTFLSILLTLFVKTILFITCFNDIYKLCVL